MEEAIKLEIWAGGGYRYRTGKRVEETGSNEGKPLWVFEGHEARIEMRILRFRRLQPERRSLILAVIPDALTEMRKYEDRTLPRVWTETIHMLRDAGLMAKCPRCGGTGQYSYHPLYGSKCFECGGTGYLLPSLTPEYIERVREYFASSRAADEIVNRINTTK